MVNLLSNAAKFTTQGHVAVEVSRAGGWCTLDVVDTGPGFPDAMAERLFQPFAQGDDSSTRRHGGSGLGLALCKRLVDAMGGDIAVVEQASGARLRVRLPNAA
jgi:signal transduction histidine kinase